MRWYWVYAASVVGLAWLSSRVAAGCGELPVIAVANETQGCVTADLLHERVLAYAADNSGCGGSAIQVQVELSPDATRAELKLARGEEVLSVRRFDALPLPCSDARDMLAVSIAMALDQLPAWALSVPAQARRASGARVHAPETRTAKLPDATVTRAAAAASGRSESSTVAPRTADALLATEPADTVSPWLPETPAASSADVGLPHDAASARSASAAQVTETPLEAHAPRNPSGNRDQPEPSRELGDGANPHGPAPRRVYLGGQALWFALPQTVWLGALGLELAKGAASLQLGGLGGGSQDLAIGRGTASLRFVGAELLGCGVAAIADVAAQLCAGVMGVAVLARGHGFDESRRATSAWGAATLVMAARWPRESWLGVRLSVRGLYSVVQPELQVLGTTEQLRPAHIGASTGLDLIFALP